jgi:hypothetical protein
MNRISKLAVGAGAAAMLTAGVAAPVEAQAFRRPYYRHHDNAAGLIAGIAVLGGLAAIASAGRRDRAYASYRPYYSGAVNACGAEAQRIGRGLARVDAVERIGPDRFRVSGFVEGDRYGYARYDRQADRFTCFAFGNGRIEDFRFRAE